MPLKTDSLEDPQLNLTPMIDVVFLLIIFFMVGARFTEEAHDQKFDVELPTASPVQAMSQQPDPLVISHTLGASLVWVVLSTTAITSFYRPSAIRAEFGARGAVA